MDEGAGTVPIVAGMTIAPREIFEGAALEIQLDWVRSELADSPQLPQILRILNPGFVDERYLTTRRLVAKRLPNVSWPARRALLLTLSDLALWGATHRDYLGGDDFEVAWEDLHPGYRFVRALDVVVESLHLSRLRKSDLSNSSTVTELVCGQLRWKTPLQMAENYLHAEDEEKPQSQVGARLTPGVIGSELRKQGSRNLRYSSMRPMRWRSTSSLILCCRLSLRRED